MNLVHGFHVAISVFIGYKTSQRSTFSLGCLHLKKIHDQTCGIFSQPPSDRMAAKQLSVPWISWTSNSCSRTMRQQPPELGSPHVTTDPSDRIAAKEHLTPSLETWILGKNKAMTRSFQTNAVVYSRLYVYIDRGVNQLYTLFTFKVCHCHPSIHFGVISN